MSGVTTFTLRDLNRQPAKVLEAVRKFGIAEVRTRKGEVFTVSPKAATGARRLSKLVPDFEGLWKKQRDAGHIVPATQENERINRIIAGEE
jgi:hypothetical protein